MQVHLVKQVLQTVLVSCCGRSQTCKHKSLAAISMEPLFSISCGSTICAGINKGHCMCRMSPLKRQVTWCNSVLHVTKIASELRHCALCTMPYMPLLSWDCGACMRSCYASVRHATHNSGNERACSFFCYIDDTTQPRFVAFLENSKIS